MSFAHSVSDSELRFTSAGVVTQAEWIAGIRDGFLAAAGGPRRTVVFECRGGGVSRTTDQLREIVDEVQKNRAKLTDRCVVLVSSNVCYGAARMFGVFMEPLGFEVVVTSDPAEADRLLHRVTPAGPTEAWPTATAGS
jgi:hypothetical protein